MGARVRILFLDASDEVLVRRYEASRRRHPLSASDRVSDGIAHERELLEELRGEADIVIDTSNVNVHELRERLRPSFADDAARIRLQTSIVSFGYKHGLPLDVDLVFDCRFLPNPHWIESLRPLIGLDEPVRDVRARRSPRPASSSKSSTGCSRCCFPRSRRSASRTCRSASAAPAASTAASCMAEELARLFAARGYGARVHHRDVARG